MKDNVVKKADEAIKKSFGGRVKEARRSIGMSQDELAQKLGYESKSSISMIECGKQDLPLSKIYEVAEALGVSVSFLVDGDANRFPPLFKTVPGDLVVKSSDQALVEHYMRLLLYADKFEDINDRLEKVEESIRKPELVK